MLCNKVRGKLVYRCGDLRLFVATIRTPAANEQRHNMAWLPHRMFSQLTAISSTPRRRARGRSPSRRTRRPATFRPKASAATFSIRGRRRKSASLWKNLVLPVPFRAIGGPAKSCAPTCGPSVKNNLTFSGLCKPETRPNEHSLSPLRRRGWGADTPQERSLPFRLLLGHGRARRPIAIGRSRLEVHGAKTLPFTPNDISRTAAPLRAGLAADILPFARLRARAVGGCPIGMETDDVAGHVRPVNAPLAFLLFSATSASNVGISARSIGFQCSFGSTPSCRSCSARRSARRRSSSARRRSSSACCRSASARSCPVRIGTPRASTQRSQVLPSPS